MIFSYLKFHGDQDEDVKEFLERLEVACISNHVNDKVMILRLLKICLKDDARTWLKAFEEQEAVAIG